MTFKLAMSVDLCMAYMPMLISMTLTLMQGHSGLGDAGTIDRFGLAFEYQIFFNIKKNGQNQSQIKKYYINA